MKREDVDIYIPDMISMLDKFIDYPYHLELVLSILINIGVIDQIGDDFIYEKYGFVSIMEDIFKTYPLYTLDTCTIHENSYFLLANLASDCPKARDQFIKAQFLEHISYLLTAKDVELKPSTVNILSYAISRFTSLQILNLRDYECLVIPIEALLHTDDGETLNYTLRALSKLLGYAPITSQIYKSLSDQNIIKVVLDIAKSPKGIHLENTLKCLCNYLAGPDPTIEYLLSNEICEILLDAKLDVYKNLDAQICS